LRVQLIQFIRQCPAEIEREWEKFAATLAPLAPRLSKSTLRDHLREILEVIADNMESPQSTNQQIEKSQGKGQRGDALDRITAAHARLRLDSGFDLEHTIAEYRALRASILRLWAQTTPRREDGEIDEVTRFNETIDQAVAEVIRRFGLNTTQYSDLFVGVLAHDLRSPLNLIQLAANQVLEGETLSKQQVGNVSRIFRGVRRIDRLINDLAILVRSRAGSPLPLKQATEDLGVICEHALDEVKASHINVRFELQRSGDLTGYWDGERLAQVITNLVINAIVHGSAENVAVVVEGEATDVMLKVTNYGTPIPGEILDSIFEPLVHGNRQPAHELSSGLGLGLFILREIVEAHGGTVEAGSSETHGTTFTVRLPRTND
jgi:signal transduction histidine kinase